jgi:hypothetical protein
MAGRRRAGRYLAACWKANFEASGFFHSEKRDGRWWLVTPDGHAVLFAGVNTVNRESSQTYIAGREYMFSVLPREGEPLAAFYGEATTAKATRPRGGPSVTVAGSTSMRPTATRPAADWQGGQQADDAGSGTLARLDAWGFNSLGNWSEPAFAGPRACRTACRCRSSATLPASAPARLVGRMPDPFDPRFAMATERAVAIAARDHRDDPWLIGYFADNELAWAGQVNTRRATTRWPTAPGASTDSPAKRAFTKQLRDKYRDRKACRKPGASNCRLGTDGRPGLPGAAERRASRYRAGLQRLPAAVADQYFKTLRDS